MISVDIPAAAKSPPCLQEPPPGTFKSTCSVAMRTGVIPSADGQYLIRQGVFHNISMIIMLTEKEERLKLKLYHDVQRDYPDISRA